MPMPAGWLQVWWETVVKFIRETYTSQSTMMPWWVVLIGVANKMQYLRRSWALPNDSKHNETSFSTISTDMLYLWAAQMPRSPIFVPTMTDKTDYFTPCACVRGNNTWWDGVCRCTCAATVSYNYVYKVVMAALEKLGTFLQSCERD